MTEPHESTDSKRSPARLAALGTAAVVMLAGAFGAGWALASRDVGTVPTPVPGPRAEPNALALAVGLRTDPTCEDLLADFVERGQEQVGPWGWGDVMYASLESDVASGAAGRDAAASPQTTRVTSNETGTNVQEAGVDEADVVKTRGDLLVRVLGDVVSVWDVSGEVPHQQGTVTLTEHGAARRDADNQLLLVGDTVVVVGVDPGDTTRTWVSSLDLSSPTDPTLTGTVEVTGHVEDVRLHGDVVRLVVNSGLPDLDFVEPGSWRSTSMAERRNLEIVADTTLADWLPTVDGAVLPGCADVAIPQDDSALGATVVAAFDPQSSESVEAFSAGSADSWRSVGIAAGHTAAYVSTDRVYLAGASEAAGGLPRCVDWCPAVGSDGRTRIDAFALDGLDTTWVAGARVDGAIADRWAMDSVGDSLRVALGTTQATGNFNSVVTFTEREGILVETGRVDHLGPGEQIKSVRWFDDLAIVVTFRQVDPLYAVDLSDPTDPTLLGELKIPGFSEYLHPLGSMRMIGLGQRADRLGRAQASLFDVTDLTDVRQLDVHAYGPNTRVGVATDPRQFTWLPKHRTVLTVVHEGWEGTTGYVSVLTLADGTLHNRMVEVEYGTDVAGVRTVPLSDGRVALVTSSDVTFFDL